MFALTPRGKRAALLPRAEFPFRWMPEEFATLVNRMFGAFPEEYEWEPRWDMKVEENEKDYLVRAEMPGFEPNEVRVEVTADRLTIEAEHKAPPETGKEEAEKIYAHVKRMMTLPPNVDAEKAEAVYRNGILEVRVPRKPEAVGRKIEVKT